MAGFGRQLLNTVVEQVLKKAPLSLQRNIRQLKKGSQLCLGGGTAAGCMVVLVGDVSKSSLHPPATTTYALCGSVPTGQGRAHIVSTPVHHCQAQCRHKVYSQKIEPSGRYMQDTAGCRKRGSAGSFSSWYDPRGKRHV